MSDGRSGRRGVVLWNPTAGSKAGLPTNSATRDELLALLDRHGLGNELIETHSEEDLVRQARRAVGERVDVVIAAGGDGTIGTVAGVLLDTGVPLGLLPLGSLMNIARSLEIPRDLDDAAEVIASGVVRAIDIGETGEKLFFECASIGLNAALFEQAQRVDKRQYGALVDAFRVLLGYRRARLRLEMDDGTSTTRAYMVTVANGPYTAFGMTFAPDARMNDGRFDVRVFEGLDRARILRHLATIALGRRDHTHGVRTYRTSRITITSSHPVPCRADALDLGTTPVTLRTRPGALRVIVPRVVETLDAPLPRAPARPGSETPPG